MTDKQATKLAAPTETPQTPQTAQLVKAEESMSVRFMNKVISEFGSSVGAIALTEFQQRLAQNYFIAADASLHMAEDKRLKKSEQYRDKLAVTWANVNLEGLARNVVACARVGLDPAQKNHINMVPYKNNTTQKYDIVFIEGYRGIEMKATKYGLDVPDAVIVELVYTNDKFKSIKKSLRNPIESYEFEVVDDFDRGEIRGGFYYHAFDKHPEKNRLVVFSKSDILKRKPNKASVEFWGGEKDVWEDKKKVGTEHVDGWFEKMCWKTIYRAAFSDITIDSQKIDSDYLRLKQMEIEAADKNIDADIANNANSEVITDAEIVPDDQQGTQAQQTTEAASGAAPEASQQPPAKKACGF